MTPSHDPTTAVSLLEVKQITRPLNDYQLPMTLAIWMNKTMNLIRNDVIVYIICEDGTSAAAMKQAHHIDEMKDPVKKSN